MTLSVADIDRWNPGDVREVFHATRSRAEAAAEAANGIAQLPAFGTWGGDASAAAKDAIGQTRKDLDAHGNEALAVARAADRAADDIEALKGKLANLRTRAHQLGMELDAASNSFVPVAGSTLTATDVALAEAELQPQLTALLAEAAAIDDELAQAINMATGKTPIPQTGPPVGPEGLTPTQVASDANEAQLEQERAGTQARVDELQHQIDELARQTYTTGDHSTATFDRLNELKDQLTSAKSYLGDLNAVHDALGKAPETYLTAFDPRTGTGKHVLAAVAVGNPDTARNVSVTVPGLGSNTQETLPGMVSEAQNLRLEAERQMRNAGVPGSAATIAWMGYDPPPNPLNTLSPRDALATIGDGQARAGADSLSSYLEQVRANNPNGHITLFGHSYGSLTSSLALQELNAQGLHPVNDVVFYGSPGLELTSPDQLGLSAGHAYVMRGVDDPIATAVAELAPLHGWGVNPYDGMFPQLSAQAGLDPGGVLREGVQSHSDYARLGSDNQLRMSGYNLAAVMAGLPDNVAMAPPPPAPIPAPQPPLIPGVPGR
ncbi:alpha/beta hydrolase [Mycobacterium sp. 3519A]|uniref:alpha/beta hydrolase n=1 Tax=Mycobacterium sp. 3519A TaxID=2057184 RepID=UPI000C7A27D5|nr:alpha/beta hydrolase [Mycobacterium sp. 3519A]